MMSLLKRALVVVDVQNEYVTGKLPIEFPSIEQSLKCIEQIMGVARRLNIPIVVVQHTAAADAIIFAEGSEGWQLHPIVIKQPITKCIKKTKASCFKDTDLALWCKTHAIDILTVVGYMIHNCDLATAIEAAQYGFHVEFISDASGALAYANEVGYASAKDIHHVVNVVLQSNFAAVLTTEEWVTAAESNQLTYKSNIYRSSQQARSQQGNL